MQREEQRAGGWPRRRSALPHPPDLALFPAPTPPRGRVPPPASLLPPPPRVTLPATCLLHEGGGARGDAFVATATAADSMEARGPCGVAVAACAAVAAIGGGGSSPLGRHDAGSAIAAWRTRVCWRVLLPPHAPYPACSPFHSTPTRHTTGLPLALCRPQPGGRHGSAGAMEGGGDARGTHWWHSCASRPLPFPALTTPRGRPPNLAPPSPGVRVGRRNLFRP